MCAGRDGRAAALGGVRVSLFGIPLEFFLFALTLIGVALFHHRALTVALAGLATTIGYKLAVTGFKTGEGLPGLTTHFEHEWVILANLALLLVGFALMANHFERSKIPDRMPNWLPNGWLGGLALLAVIFVLSAILDNIASAIIGGVVARHLYRDGVTVGYIAAIVAAANAGGAPSVIGDTTTTMMWLEGVDPLLLAKAVVAAVPAFLVFATFAAIQQQMRSPILKHATETPVKIDGGRLVVVAIVLISLISANVASNTMFKGIEEQAPVLGLAVWAALIVTAVYRWPDWKVVPSAFKGALFLVSLVALASLMPVESLPAASWQTALGLGFVSSVFDNIPLTALALNQGGYDWALLAYAVGFGGSMIWFGSSAGVAISNLYPQARSVWRWMLEGWPILVAYPVGFFVMLHLLGWQPS